MSEELKAAQARIACLEGEIAKRDEELAACRIAVENCEVFRARIVELTAELAESRKCAEIMQQGAFAYQAELAAIKAQGVVMPAELDRAFITGESCDGVYRVAIQSETLKEMQAVHSWLTSLNAAPAAPAAPVADATVRQATDGGRNQSYEGLFDGETEEQRASRLAAHRTQGAV